MSTKDLSIDPREIFIKVMTAMHGRREGFASKFHRSDQVCPCCEVELRQTGFNMTMECYGGPPIERNKGYTYTCYNFKCDKYLKYDLYYDESIDGDFELKEM